MDVAGFLLQQIKYIKEACAHTRFFNLLANCSEKLRNSEKTEQNTLNRSGILQNPKNAEQNASNCSELLQNH